MAPARKGIPQTELGTVALRPRQQFGHESRRGPGGRAVNHREIPLIDHQCLPDKALAVLSIESVRKSLAGLTGSGGDLTAANYVRPQRNLRARYISPQDIQPLVPGVQLVVIGALETSAAQAKDLYVITKHSLDEISGNVRGVRNALSGDKLALHDRVALQREHGCYRRSAAPTRTCAVGHRCTREFGSSSASGL